MGRVGELELGVEHPCDLETSAVDLPDSGGDRVAVSVSTGKYVKCGCSRAVPDLDKGR